MESPWVCNLIKQNAFDNLNAFDITRFYISMQYRDLEKPY